MCLLVRDLLSGWDCRAREEHWPRRQKVLGLSLSTEKANTFINFLSIRTLQLCVESTRQYILIIFLQAVSDQSVASWRKTGSLPHLVLRAVQTFLVTQPISALQFHPDSNSDLPPLGQGAGGPLALMAALLHAAFRCLFCLTQQGRAPLWLFYSVPVEASILHPAPVIKAETAALAWQSPMNWEWGVWGLLLPHGKAACFLTRVSPESAGLGRKNGLSVRRKRNEETLMNN